MIYILILINHFNTFITMKKILETVSGTLFDVDLYFFIRPTGYGNWYILCDVEFNQHKKTFKCHTTKSEIIDTIFEMKAGQSNFEEVQEYIYSQIFDEIIFEVEEWLYINFE